LEIRRLAQQSSLTDAEVNELEHQCLRAEELDALDKKSFSLDAKSKMNLVKHIVAMANSGGGILALGISNAPAIEGIGDAEEGWLDPTTIADQLRKKVARVPEFAVCKVELGGKKVAFVLVHSASPPQPFSSDGGHETGTIFREGDLYIRSGASTRKVTSDFMMKYDRQVRRDTLNNFLGNISVVAQLPPEAELHVSDEPGSLPVHLAGHGETPVFYVSRKRPETLAEELEVYCSLYSFSDELMARNNYLRMYRAKDELTEVEDTANELLLLSGMRHYEPSFLWAWRLNSVRLQPVLEKAIERDEFYMMMYAAHILYVVGAEWAQDLLMCLTGDRRTSVANLASSYLEEWDCDARATVPFPGTATFYLGHRTLELASIEGDEEEEIGRLIADLVEGRGSATAARSAARKLDCLVFGQKLAER